MKERSIFVKALEHSDPDERSAFLEQACGGDKTLRRRIEALLKRHTEASQFLEQPAVDAVATELASGDEQNPRAASGDTLPDLEIQTLAFLAPSDNPDALGRLGQYEILEVIGRGGMGIVLRGVDPKLNRVVAIKVLSPDFAVNPTAHKRFLREAQAAAAVSHDHIVTIYAVEEQPIPHLAMEFIDGKSLQQKIDEEGQLELKEVLRIARQVAAGLSAAHEQGLTHRDIKPSNILLQNGIQRVQITDFGLARVTADADITRTGEIAGTPQYMSPEQARSESVDPRSDLFSLGSVMYAMCCGHSPFRAETPYASIKRVCENEPRSIRESNPEIPPWLEEIVFRLLEKHPDDRFQTAAEVAELLGKHLSHLQDPGATVFPGFLPVADRTLLYRHRRSSGRQRVVASVVVLLLVALAFGFTEASGVTHLASTVIRMATGEGTLQIEIDDPTVQVSLDGEELNISGAGIQELKLRPGQYNFQATKDGAPVKTELVTITRGDRQVMRVSLEPNEEFVPAEPVSSIPSSDILFSDDWTWTEPVNLGPNVNSENTDSAPVLSQDGLTLLFSSNRPEGMGKFDLWMCRRSSPNDEWSPAINLGPAVNSDSTDAEACLSADGLTLLFASDRKGGSGHWDIWMSTRESLNAPWSEAVSLGPPINSSGLEASPELSSDGLVLLFHSKRPGAGDSELWLSRRASLNGEWSEPIWLGSSVNSEKNDSSPCLSVDGRSLIFSSERSGSFGAYDLWISRGASPFGPWSEPVNLGPLINGGGNDGNATLSADCGTLIYESGRPGNLGAHDLWMSRRVPKVNHLQLARQLAEQNRLDEAAPEFSLALDLAESRSLEGARSRYAILRQIWPNEDLYQRVSDLRPRDINMVRDRGYFLAQDGRWADSAEYYGKRLALGPDGAGCWKAYAMALLGNKDIDGYRELCAQIIEQFSDIANPLEAHAFAWTLAAIPGAVEDRQAAFSIAERAFHQAPENVWCQRTYAIWLYRTDRLQEAIEIIERIPSTALTATSGNNDILFFAAMAYSRLGNDGEARDWANRATELIDYSQTHDVGWQYHVFIGFLNDEMKQTCVNAPLRANKPNVENPLTIP